VVGPSPGTRADVAPIDPDPNSIGTRDMGCFSGFGATQSILVSPSPRGTAYEYVYDLQD